MIAHVKAYIDSLQTGSRPRSLLTLQSYERDLAQLLRYLADEGLGGAEDVQKHHLSLYFHRLKGQGRAAATISRQMVSVRAFFHYLQASGAIRANPALHLEAPKPDRSAPAVLSLEEVERLLEAPDTGDTAGQRDAAMLELLYGAGMRVSEMIALDLGHIDLGLGFIRCTDARGKERIIPLGETAGDALRTYMDRSRPKMAGGNELALFLNRRGGRMTRQGFWKIVKKYALAAGIGGDLTPHDLRHAFAAHLLQNGADLRSVQELLGHADLQTTHMYVQPAKTRIKEVYGQAHPRAKRNRKE